jgi:hypothetical protein
MQGYGSLEKVPTFYGLWWNSPEYVGRVVPVGPGLLRVANFILSKDIPDKLGWLLGFFAKNALPILARLQPRKPAPQAVLNSGFSKLWQNIVKKEQLNVKLGCPVKMIDRTGQTPRVTYRDVAAGKDVTISDINYVVVRVNLLLLCKLYTGPCPFLCIK